MQTCQMYFITDNKFLSDVVYNILQPETFTGFEAHGHRKFCSVHKDIKLRMLFHQDVENSGYMIFSEETIYDQNLIHSRAQI